MGISPTISIIYSHHGLSLRRPVRQDLQSQKPPDDERFSTGAAVDGQ
jgi:hypothetical protein